MSKQDEFLSYAIIGLIVFFVFLNLAHADERTIYWPGKPPAGIDGGTK